MYEITSDDYFTKTQPAKSEEIANVIEVYVLPLLPAQSESEVYKSKDPIIVPANSTRQITISYEKPPVLDATAYVTDTSAVVVASSSLYAWGGTITLENPSGSDDTVVIVINGIPLTIQGEEIITVRDEASIREYGLQKYTLPKNHLIQSRVMAERIANTLLQSYKTVRKDVEIDWRGNPALELLDVIRVPEYQKNGIDNRSQYYITKNAINFDGTLRQQTSGRKIS
jgi:hypothetical protein